MNLELFERMDAFWIVFYRELTQKTQ